MLRKQWAFFAEFFTLEAIAARAANDDSPPVGMPQMSWDELMAFFAPRDDAPLDETTQKQTIEGGGEKPFHEPSAGYDTGVRFPFTIITKIGDRPMSKLFEDRDGKLHKDASQCAMGGGWAERAEATLEEFAEVLDSCPPHKAIVLGSLRPDLPNRVKIVSKKKWTPDCGAITRSLENFGFYGRPTLAMFDNDTGGMPTHVKERIGDATYDDLLCKWIPGYAEAGRDIRPSTSSGLYNEITSLPYPGSSNSHTYVGVKDGTDIPRFTKLVHKQAWLDDCGWIAISAVGSLLVRSPIDISVPSPERLIFEGRGVLTPPVAQHDRPTVVIKGGLLDSRAHSDLGPEQELEFERRVAAAKAAARPEADGAWPRS